MRVREAMKRAGLNTEIFSGGGTGTYNLQHLVPGFTDVQVGSYVFMDMQYLAIGSEDGNAGLQRLRLVADGRRARCSTTGSRAGSRRMPAPRR